MWRWVCCSVLQCVAVCCSVLQSAAVCCSLPQSSAVCYSLPQNVAVGSVCFSVHSVFECVRVLLLPDTRNTLQCVAVCCSVLQCVVMCCSTPIGWHSKCDIQCVAVCWHVLQCAAVCCSVLQCVAVCCSTPIGWHSNFEILLRYDMRNMIWEWEYCAHAAQQWYLEMWNITERQRIHTCVPRKNVIICFWKRGEKRVRAPVHLYRAKTHDQNIWRQKRC